MRIGTRASTMALAQTNDVIARLKADAAIDAELVKFSPRGDRDQTSKLLPHGGKGGAFVSEIRDAIREGQLEAAMHSLKDMPGDEEAPGLCIGAFIERDDYRDALVLRPALSLEEFEAQGGAGFKVGTNAVRRAAFLKRLYPNAEVIHYRGAADTRLRKLDDAQRQEVVDGEPVGPADALVMACSGLERIGRASRIARIFTIDEMLPSVGQGIVALECKTNDWQTRATLEAINHEPTRICALAERELLWVLDGHCNAPIAGFATIANEKLTLRGAVLDLNGTAILQRSITGYAARPREAGRELGLELLRDGAATLIASSKP